ncbi:unnamed protein product [Pieris brassicae]|uniref:Uncharacterized protein n=1 Tax=Pieris brassicae TaxID=7116 RepID=A0A9P0TII5_PIEBR|nr:unnamed protein product [Pieris brassicae]
MIIAISKAIKFSLKSFLFCNSFVLSKKLRTTPWHQINQILTDNTGGSRNRESSGDCKKPCDDSCDARSPHGRYRRLRGPRPPRITPSHRATQPTHL